MNRIRTRTRRSTLAATASLIASMGIAGISAGQQPTSPPGQTQQEGSQPQPQSREGSDSSARVWPGDMLHSALGLSTLTPTQKNQIQALINSRTATHANVQAAHAELLNALADGVDSGSVNATALAPKVQMLVAAIQADEPADRAAVEKLHAILTPAQRSELVNQVQPRMQDEQQPQKGDGWLAREVNFTPAQESQFEANLRNMEPPTDENARNEARDEHQRVLDAFKGDTFIMNQVAPMKNPQAIQRRAEHIVIVAQAATPVMTTEQRAMMASKLRSWASKSGM